MPVTFTMPKLSPTMEEGTIVKWHKKEGEQVKADELLIEVATDKATVEHQVLDAGWLRKILVKEGEHAKVNQPIAIFTETKEESIAGYQPEGEVIAPEPLAAAAPATKAPSFVTESPLPPMEKSRSAAPPVSGRVIASPLAKKLAQQKGVDLSTIVGSGPNNRIMSRDLENATPQKTKSQPKAQKPAGSFTEEILTPMRKVIAQRLQEAKATIPHFYVSIEVDGDHLSQLREQLHKGNIAITYNDLMIRACALSLKEHPNVNSGFNAAKGTLIRFQTIDIAVAVTVPGGLITPIIRYADEKSVFELSQEMHDLAARAKAGKLTEEEYKGGSFTLSNMGMYGITDFQAILNPPQAAILAVGGLLEKPVVKEGKLTIGKRMTLSLSADHRVIDGVTGALFLKTVQKYLENPVLLIAI